VHDARISGHAIEARLYAEDVVAGYVPVSGRIHELDVPWHVRNDSGYEGGSVVSPYYDAMLTKVIADAPTRGEAAAELAAALAAARIHGITTNRDLLVAVLRSPEFLAGATDTGFLDRFGFTAPVVDGEARRIHAVAAWLADRARRASRSPLPAGIPPAFRTVGPAAQPFVLDDALGRTELVARDTRGRTLVEHDGELLDVSASHAFDDETWSIDVDGRRVVCELQLVDDRIYVDSALGHSDFALVERFPLPQSADDAGSLHSPMPGAVVRVAVVPGDPVAAGAVLLTLEAMKMEHAVRAPHDGVVREVRVAAGDQVDAGTVLVVLDVSEPLEP
jgi:acetyl/propionyl-CoA carboxylase alpha subunit